MSHPPDCTAQVIGGIAYNLISLLAKLTAVLFGVLVAVAGYNGFIDSDAVQTGWGVARDVCNMFFVMVLLVISFGTLFRMPQYRYTTLLRKFVIMAVLINFSLGITGFFIDIMQLIMMTFVNAFSSAAAGNLAHMLGLTAIFNLDPNASAGQVTNGDIMSALLLGLFMMIIAFIVILVMVLMLLGRIIALWILAVLSPFAYFLSTFPHTQSWAKKWWSTFWQYATIGPVLAFFLWLSFTITGSGVHHASELITTGSGAATVPSESTVPGQGGTLGAAGGATNAFISEVGTNESILSFMVGIILLVAGLTVASRAGVAGGSFAGTVAGNIQKGAVGIGRIPFRAATGAGKGALAVGGFAVGALGTGAAALGAGIKSRVPLAKTVSEIPQNVRRRVATLPLVGRPMARYIASTEKQKKEREEKEAGWVDNLKDPLIQHQIVNGPAFTARQKAEKKRMRNIAPNMISDQTKMIAQIQSMELADFQKVSPLNLAHMTARLHEGGTDLETVSEEKAEWGVRSANSQKRKALGLQTSRWDPATGAITGTISDPDIASSRVEDRRRLHDMLTSTGATPAMLATLFPAAGGSAAGARPMADVGLDEEMVDLQNQAIAEGRLNLDTITVGKGSMRASRDARERGETPERMRVLANFADHDLAGLGLSEGAAGYQLKGEQKNNAVGVLSTKLRKQLTEEGKHTGEEVDTMVSEFEDTANAAQELHLGNKQRFGTDIRTALRHEDHHSELDRLPMEMKRALFEQLSEDRKEEIRSFVKAQAGWGPATSDDDIVDEYLATAAATYGRKDVADRYGPLKINDDEADLALQLKASGVNVRMQPQAAPTSKPAPAGQQAPARTAPGAAAETVVEGARAQAAAAPAAPTFVIPPPSGERGISAQPPERIVERTFEAPISPEVKRVVSNTGIEAIRNDLATRLDRVGADTPHADVGYGLEQLRSKIEVVANEQGVAGEELRDIRAELGQLMGEAASPDRTREGSAALKKNVLRFLGGLRGGSDGGIPRMPKEGGEDEGGAV